VIAVDTSVAIAALSPWHERRADAAATCKDGAKIPAHALFEAYATLTRMPEPLRISGHVAVAAPDRAWGRRTLVPPADLTTAVPRILARASVTGGSSFNALVALTAQAHERTLISLDLRAERTYRLLGITYRLLTEALDDPPRS
jgi:hypothetical protein